MNELERLYQLVKKLRSPDGCPWDRVQGQEDLARYLLNETYEVVDAVRENDAPQLKEELGDLLFQIVFLSVLAEENGDFTLREVISHVEEKMIRRHPHVFAGTQVEGVGEVKKNWELLKRGEGKSLLDGVPKSMPALRRAQEVTKRAARVGFDWADIDGLWGKMAEELGELKEAMEKGDDREMRKELGDLLFTCVNLARFLRIEAEEALEETTNRFIERFTYVEERLKEQGKKPEEASLKEMDALWEEAKKR